MIGERRIIPSKKKNANSDYASGKDRTHDARRFKIDIPSGRGLPGPRRLSRKNPSTELISTKTHLRRERAGVHVGKDKGPGKPIGFPGRVGRIQVADVPNMGSLLAADAEARIMIKANGEGGWTDDRLTLLAKRVATASARQGARNNEKTLRETISVDPIGQGTGGVGRWEKSVGQSQLGNSVQHLRSSCATLDMVYVPTLHKVKQVSASFILTPLIIEKEKKALQKSKTPDGVDEGLPFRLGGFTWKHNHHSVDH
ncbi:hypothetical protein B0H14DRAFT_2573895 [Mycena olivaceomarginata]|nr:hypothetical protein B0H14DRAFT_2573895 [Mycena olivaceomarginata]